MDFRRSSGSCILLVDGAGICWKVKLSPTVSLSTQEAQDYALSLTLGRHQGGAQPARSAGCRVFRPAGHHDLALRQQGWHHHVVAPRQQAGNRARVTCVVTFVANTLNKAACTPSSSLRLAWLPFMSLKDRLLVPLMSATHCAVWVSRRHVTPFLPFCAWWRSAPFFWRRRLSVEGC